jgi:hypothetical protein
MKPIHQLIRLLQQKLHLNVNHVNREIKYGSSIPLAIKKRFEIDLISIEGIEVAVLSSDELNTKGLQKHLELFEKALQLPLLLNISKGNGSLQKFLMEKNIPFVMGEDAVYMPRFLIWIKDLSGKPKFHPANGKKLSKLAQMVIIRMLMSQKKDIDINAIVEIFNVSMMSASRVLNELFALKLLNVEKSGREKIYHLAQPIPADKLLALMDSPKRGVVFVKKSVLSKMEGLMSASFHALSHYSDLASMNDEYAMKKSRFDTGIETYSEAYDDDYVKVELWKYDPSVLDETHRGIVDPISLYLSMKDDRAAMDDIRVENAIESLHERIKEVCSG